MNRRDFLKMLGATGAVTVLPLPALASGQTASLEISEVSIDEVAIDAPVTSDTPFAWIEIDEVRYAAKSIKFCRDVMERVDDMGYRTFIPSSFVDLDASIYGGVDHALIWRDDLRVGLSIPGVSAVQKYVGYINDMSNMAYAYGEMETDMRLTLRRA